MEGTCVTLQPANGKRTEEGLPTSGQPAISHRLILEIEAAAKDWPVERCCVWCGATDIEYKRFRPVREPHGEWHEDEGWACRQCCSVEDYADERNDLKEVADILQQEDASEHVLVCDNPRSFQTGVQNRRTGGFPVVELRHLIALAAFLEGRVGR